MNATMKQALISVGLSVFVMVPVLLDTPLNTTAAFADEVKTSDIKQQEADYRQVLRVFTQKGMQNSRSTSEVIDGLSAPDGEYNIYVFGEIPAISQSASSNKPVEETESYIEKPLSGPADTTSDPEEMTEEEEAASGDIDQEETEEANSSDSNSE